MVAKVWVSGEWNKDFMGSSSIVINGLGLEQGCTKACLGSIGYPHVQYILNGKTGVVKRTVVDEIEK